MQVSETLHPLVPRFSQALRKLFNNVDFEVMMQVLISQKTSRKCERNSDKVCSKAGRAFKSGKHLQKAKLSPNGILRVTWILSHFRLKCWKISAVVWFGWGFVCALCACLVLSLLLQFWFGVLVCLGFVVG